MNHSKNTCPQNAELLKFLDETLVASSSTIEQHVEACSSCQQRLERLTDIDVPGLKVKAHNIQADPQRPAVALQKMMQRLVSVDRVGHGLLADSSQGFQSTARNAPELANASPKRSSIDSSLTENTFPDVIGQFRIVKKLGKGGTGTLYEAIDTANDRIVALKIMHKWLSVSSNASKRMEREASAASRVRHPGVVSIFAFVAEPDRPPMLVMERLSGETLSDVIRSGKLTSTKSIATLLAGAVRGVAALHSAGLIHRDIKPSNLLLDYEIDSAGNDYNMGKKPQASARRLISRNAIASGSARPRIDADNDYQEARDQAIREEKRSQRRLVVADLGLIRDEEASVDLTHTENLLGTPAYMSPEQIHQPNQVDQRSDVYSLGCVLYQMLTTLAPFEGSTRMVLWQAVHEDPRPPRLLNENVDRDIETICLKAMARVPADRYPTAMELAEDLDRYVSGKRIHGRTAGPVKRALRWSAKNRSTATACLSLAVMLIGVAATSMMATRSMAISKTEAMQAKNEALASEKLAKEQAEIAIKSEAATKEQSDRVLSTLISMRAPLSSVTDPDRHIDAMERVDATTLGLSLAERSVELSEILLNFRPDDPDVISNNGLSNSTASNICRKLGKHEDVLEHCRKSLVAWRRLVQFKEHEVFAKHNITWAHVRMAESYTSLGNLQQAREQYEEALIVCRRLTNTDFGHEVIADRVHDLLAATLPKEVVRKIPSGKDQTAHNSLFQILIEYADLLEKSNENAAAISALREARRLGGMLVDGRDVVEQSPGDLIDIHFENAKIDQAQGKLKAAIASLLKAVAISDGIVAERPDDLPLLRIAVRVTEKLGELYLQAQNAGAAQTQFSKCVSYAEKLCELDTVDMASVHQAIEHNKKLALASHANHDAVTEESSLKAALALARKMQSAASNRISPEALIKDLESRVDKLR